jgi:ribosomal protein S12 methylthiotransferase accessory factor
VRGAFAVFRSIHRPYKERAPAETIAAIRHILADLDLLPDEIASANPYPGLHSVRLGLPASQGGYASNGKGRSTEYCQASAHAEFMERMQNGLFASLPRTLVAPFRDRYGFYYAPDERYLTEEQFRALPGDVMHDLVRRRVSDKGTFIRLYFDRARANGAPGVVAVPFYDTGSRRVVYLPLNLLLQSVSSNGMAAGNTLAEAIFQACCELLERWAAWEVYQRQLTPPAVPRSWLQKFTDEWSIIETIERGGKYKVTAKDFSAGLRIPALGLIIENTRASTYRLNVGCDTSFQVALSRCLTEVYQGMADEEEFDRWALPIPGTVPAYLTSDDLASRYRRSSAFFAFIATGVGPYPSTLFGQEPSYPFSPDVWGVASSYDAEVRRLVGFFHAIGHNVYIRDVSFLGFPAVLVYVPGVSDKYTTNLSAPGFHGLPLSIALDDVEARALQLKRCSDEDLAAIAAVFDRLPRASSLVRTFGIQLKGSSPWRQVNLGFVLAQIWYRLGQYGKARESIQQFLDARSEEYRYGYYDRVSRYLARRAEGLPHAEAVRQLAEDSDWGEAGRLLAEEMAEPRDVFRFTKLPNCPDCAECELRPDCITTGSLALVEKIYPAMCRDGIEQTALAWVNS